MSLLYSTFSLLADLGAALSLWLIFRLVFLKKPVRAVWAYVLFVLLFAADSFLLAPFLSKYLYDFDGIADIASTLFLVAASYALFDDRRQAKTLLTVVIYDATVEMFFSLAAPYIGQSLVLQNLVLALMHLAVAGAVLLAAKRTDINVLPEVFEGIPKWVWGVLFLFELTCYYKVFGEAPAWYSVLYTLSSAAVILCVMYLVFRIFWLIRRQNGILEQLETRQTFGERLITDDEELRRFRHDYRNHLIVINALLGAGRTDEAREYLATMSASAESAINRISSGCFVADAILNNKAVSAAGYGGSLYFEGRIPENSVPDADLCTVLANLLDNAVEAIRKNPAEKRRIDVLAGVVNGCLIITVENPAAGQSGTKTTKADRRNHGLGLKNVRRAAENNGGTLVISAQNGVFRAEVMLSVSGSRIPS
ncbi:MAG: GHKL domain-containing protein [Clostridia bacterium]|nr:GHKL domain-containing protein [Clostridia bacterium]